MPLFRWRVFATSEFHPPPSTCVEAMVLISRVFVVQKAKKLLARLSLLPSLKKVMFFAFKMCSQKRFRVFWRTHSLFIHFLIFKKKQRREWKIFMFNIWHWLELCFSKKLHQKWRIVTLLHRFQSCFFRASCRHMIKSNCSHKMGPQKTRF